jgi:hypothetical protein
MRRRIVWPLAALATAAAVAWFAPEPRKAAPKRAPPEPRVPLEDVPMTMSRPTGEAAGEARPPAAPSAERGDRQAPERTEATNRR